MSGTKPVKLYSHARGPNPSKVVIILQELNIPYSEDFVDISAIKQEPYTTINPNGRVPAISDPNTGIVLWESGAIIEYLLEVYDKGSVLSYTSFPEKYTQAQWKHFQMSGQGPYFGQKGWFAVYQPEKDLTSVLDRYSNEIRRILGVVELHLTRTGQPYLVGDRVTFADLMFVPWNLIAEKFLMGPDFAAEWQQKYPKCWAWHQKLVGRDSVQAMLKAQEAAIAAGH